MLRYFHLTFKVAASLLVVLTVIILAVIWRLNAGPVKSAVLTPYIVSSIERFIPGARVEIAHTLTTWDNTDQSVALHADGVRITDARDVVIADIPNLDIRLSVLGAMFGQFLPTELTIDHPQMRLERHPDGAFYFGGLSTESKATGGNFRHSLARAARQLTHALITHKLQVHRAVFDVHDIATDTSWSVNIPEIALERSGSLLEGDLSVDVTQKDQTATLRVHYAYDRGESLHRFMTRFNDIVPAFFAGGRPGTVGLGPAAIFNLPLTGEISLALDDSLALASASAAIHGDEGILTYSDFWDKPRAVKSLDIKGDYDEGTGHLNISNALFDFGGPTLALTMTGEPPALSSHDLDVTITAQINNWPIDRYRELWPKPIIPNPSDWIAANLSAGKFNHGEVMLKGSLNWDNLGNIVMTEGNGKITASSARVRYLEGMPLVNGVNAEAVFDLKKMTVQISGGGIGDIKIQPFTMTITGLDETLQIIDIPLKVVGPVPGVMDLIDQPRLEYAKAVGLKPADIDGKMEAVVNFRFPLLKELNLKDAEIKAVANLTGLSSSKLVKGFDITQGNLALGLTKEGFEIKGPVNLNKVPFQIEWKQVFQENTGKPLRQATVKGTITAEQWKVLGINAFNGTRGPIAVSVELVQPSKAKTFVSGMLDMTAAEVKIDQMGWSKGANIPASMKFAAEMQEGEDISVTSLEMKGPQLNIKGDASLSSDGSKLLSLTLNPMIVGRTNAILHFLQSEDDDGPLHFDASGEALDISGLKGSKEPEHTNPRPREYRLKINKLYTSETGFITEARGYAIRDLKGWSEISLRGMADGGHLLNVNLTPKPDGRRVFAITCDDFGKALKGLGFTDTVRDGEVDIRGESDPENLRAIVGEAKIGHFVVGHLPALVVLMNAASPFGFVGLFTGSMEFDGLRGKFRWEGDTIKLSDTHAAGAAIGINVAGKVNMDTAEADLYGNMAPFSMVNSIIGSIPLIGDLITGGEGQGVLAVSYKITGPLDNPNISVNPVSLLTPGFLRNIFFGGGDSEDEEKAPETTPAP